MSAPTSGRLKRGAGEIWGLAADPNGLRVWDRRHAGSRRRGLLADDEAWRDRGCVSSGCRLYRHAVAGRRSRSSQTSSAEAPARSAAATDVAARASMAPLCAQTRTKAVRDRNGDHRAVGSEPFFAAPVRRDRPIPALLVGPAQSTDGHYGAKFYQLLRPDGPAVVRLRGWRLGAPGAPIEFQILHSSTGRRVWIKERLLRRSALEFQPRRSFFLGAPGAIRMRKPGCYALVARWPGGGWRVGLLIPDVPPRPLR